MASRDFYEVLGVDRSASAEDIRRAYKRLARENHPDINPDDSAAEERFKEITRAHEVLSDGDKRKVYDEFGMDAEPIDWDPKQARTYQQWASNPSRGGTGGFGFGGFGSGAPDLSDLFGDLFASGQGFGFGTSRRPTGPRPGPDIRTSMTVSFEEAVLGGERRIRLEKPGPWVPCAACGGSGQARVSQAGVDVVVPCPQCGGEGQVAGAPERVTLDVKVPPGVDDGQTIRLKGQGGSGIRGGPGGDLLIELSVQTHPRFRRDGRDLHLDVPLTVGEAMLGADIEIPGLDGKRLRLKVPRGVRSGQKLRLGGKGVAGAGSRPAGHLYVHLAVVVPPVTDGDEALEEAARRIDAAYEGPVRADLE